MKWRPQISLLSLLLLMTTLALAVSLWQMGRDIVPLRNTVRDLREELGQFNVVDLDRVHVQRGETVAGNSWKWRVFLPDKFTLHVGEGVLDELTPGEFAFWKEAKPLRKNSLNLDASGQFTLELAVEEHGGNWWVKSATKNQVRSMTQLKGDWYAELSNQVQYSDASYERVAITAATEPVVLLYVRRGEKEQVDDTFVTNQIPGEAQSLVIWLEPPPASSGRGSRTPRPIRPVTARTSVQ